MSLAIVVEILNAYDLPGVNLRNRTHTFCRRKESSDEIS